MPLSRRQLEDVCLFREHDCRTCRYLSDDCQSNMWFCIKKRPKEKKKIDIKINEFIKSCKKKGVDPTAQNFPLGDNCKGYPVMKHIVQGYDQKN